MLVIEAKVCITMLPWLMMKNNIQSQLLERYTFLLLKKER